MRITLSDHFWGSFKTLSELLGQKYTRLHFLKKSTRIQKKKKIHSPSESRDFSQTEHLYNIIYSEVSYKNLKSPGLKRAPKQHGSIRSFTLTLKTV